MKHLERYQETDRILSEIHYEIHEFLKTFHPLVEAHLIGERRQRPFCRLSLCEIMRILVAYQVIGAANFKQFYKKEILQDHRQAFPNWISYSRFVEVAPMALIPLSIFLKFRMEMSQKTGLYVIDSTPLRVCQNLRIPRHRGFASMAERGKSPTGWFYGFKLHLVTNHHETILCYCLVHARRKFFECFSRHPDECTLVLKWIAKIYRVDRLSKDHKMSPNERMTFHTDLPPSVFGKDWLIHRCRT